MAPKAGSSGSPNQILVVFLILFILTSLALGVTTYLGFDGQTKLADDAKKADGKAKEWEGKYDLQKFVAEYLRAVEGKSLPSDKALATLRPRWVNKDLTNKVNEEGKEDLIKLIDGLDKTFGWDEQAKKPANNFETLLALKQKELDALTKKFQNTDAGLTQARTELQAAQADLEKAGQAYAAELKKAKEKADTDLNKYLVTIKDLQGQLDAKGVELEKARTDMAAAAAEFEKKMGG